MLDNGENAIQVSWVGVRTPEINVNQLIITDADKAIIREQCIRSQSPGNNCDAITIRFDDRPDSEIFQTFSDIDEHLNDQYGLGVYYDIHEPQDELGPIMFINVLVPTFEKDYYLEKLEADPLLPNVFSLSF